MEEFFLKAKHYQIFLSISLPALFATFIPNFDPDVQLIKIIVITLPYIIWIFMIGKALNLCAPARYRLSETFLIINLFAFGIIFVLIVMFLDYTVTFHGWTVIIPFYMIFSFFYLFYFASKALTTTERGKRTSFSEHLSEMFLLLTGYFGIWFMQPRINQIWEKNKNKFIEEDIETE